MKNALKKCVRSPNFVRFPPVHWWICVLAVPHQSRFARQLPPGGSQGRSRASVKHQFVPLLLKADSLNWNLSFRTENCPVPFRAAAGADRIADRTVTHWPRALPAKFQFIAFLRKGSCLKAFYSVAATTALMVCIRFSASSNTMERSDSKT